MLTRQQFLKQVSAAAAVPLLPRGVHAQAAPARMVNVRDFGARADGATDDARAIASAIQSAVALGEGSTVVLPAGRYLLRTVTQARARSIYTSAEPGIDLGRIGYALKAHILLNGLRDLTLLGEPGTVLILKDATASGIALERCENVTVENIAIDYDPLPFTQGVVTAVEDAARAFEWKVDSAFVEPPNGYLALSFDPVGDSNPRGLGFGNVFDAGGALKTTAGNGGDVPLREMREMGGSRYACTSDTALRALNVGDRFGWAPRAPLGGHAVALTLSNRCRIVNVTVHAAPVLAFLANDCDGLVFQRCTIGTPPGSERLFAANADGIHAKSNRTGPRIENCRFERHGDDSVTVVQAGQALYEVLSPTELLVELDQYQLYLPGNRVALVAQDSGLSRGEARVVDVRLVRYRDRNARQVTLDRALPRGISVESLELMDIPPPPAGRDRGTPLAERPDLLVDLDLVGAGFQVRNNMFANHRAGGMRIYSRDGLVENNRFENLTGHGLQLGMELAWPEVHHASRITIRGNRFVNLANTANIWIGTRLGDYSQGQGMANNDIAMEGNTFTGYGARLPGPASGCITVSNGQNIRIRGNTFETPDPAQNPQPRAVRLDVCRDITIEDNTMARRDALLDPVAITPRADRASIRVRNNKYVR